MRGKHQQQGPVRTQSTVETQSSPHDETPIEGRQVVFRDAAGNDVYTEPAPPRIAHPPRGADVAAEVERLARKLVIEEEEQRAAMARRGRVRRMPDGRFVHADGTEVQPHIAFPDATDPDGSEMIGPDGESLVKPGFVERWVRFEYGSSGEKLNTRINQFKRDGYEPVINPATNQPLLGPLGMAMQAPIATAAERTKNKTPFGAVNPRQPIKDLEDSIRNANSGLGYQAIRPYTKSERVQTTEEHYVTLDP